MIDATRNPNSSLTSQLDSVLAVSTMIMSSLEEDTVRQNAIEATRTLINCDATSLLLVNETTGGLYFDVAIGDQGERVKTIELAKGQGIAGWVAEHREPVIIQDAQNDTRLFRQADSSSGFKTRNMLCVPIMVRSKLIGVLQALNKKQGTFNDTDSRMLASLAAQIGVALDNARLYHALNDTFHAVIQVLIEAIEKRDPNAAGHAKRVSMYSVAIGKEMGLDRAQLVNLKLAALLHDVGMMSLSDDMLVRRRGGDVSKFREQQIIKKHLEMGTDLLHTVKPLHHLLPIIKFHHELYDGSGPHRLVGEKIPLLARIIVVADHLDAMLNDRPYGTCLGYDSALLELERSAGRKFDPKVVKALMQSKSVKMARRFFNY
ncbi:MAG: GAF domain-containing protein [Gammaproteobacteria bacterium]|nr:GAF domain-containing protein [Gammaproteobacteria bacterium]